MKLTPAEARFLAAATLGIRVDAPLADAKAAWLGRVREAHPDRGGDPDTFQAVQAAWEVWQMLEPAPPAAAPRTVARPRHEPAPRVIRRDRVAQFDVHTKGLPDLSAR